MVSFNGYFNNIHYNVNTYSGLKKGIFAVNRENHFMFCPNSYDCPPPLMFFCFFATITKNFLIVLSEVEQKIDRWIRDIAWEVGFENDRVITTVLVDKEQFEHGPMSESTIVANILRKGISG